MSGMSAYHGSAFVGPHTYRTVHLWCIVKKLITNDYLNEKLFRYLMLFVFLWGITSQIEAKKEKRVIIQGIEYSLTTRGILYGSVDNLKQNK